MQFTYTTLFVLQICLAPILCKGVLRSDQENTLDTEYDLPKENKQQEVNSSEEKVNPVAENIFTDVFFDDNDSGENIENEEKNNDNKEEQGEDDNNDEDANNENSDNDANNENGDNDANIENGDNDANNENDDNDANNENDKDANTENENSGVGFNALYFPYVASQLLSKGNKKPVDRGTGEKSDGANENQEDTKEIENEETDPAQTEGPSDPLQTDLPSENITQDENATGKADNLKQEILPNDYNTEENKSVDLEENDKDCPTVCPAREMMVCGQCSHMIYRTFLSPCHLRMYACQNPKEKLKLVSRRPCAMSAPALIGLPTAKGVLGEPNDHDNVIKYVKCRAKGRLGKGDSRCDF